MPSGAPDHSHTHARGFDHSALEPRGDAPRRVLAIALGLTFAFMLVEAAVGWWANSLALLADAGHMLSDVGALLLSFIIAGIAVRPRDRARTYGYRRAEVMGAFLNALTIVVLSSWIAVEAVERFKHPPDVKGPEVLITAAIGLLVNIASAWVLIRGGSDNVNVRAAMLHVMGDALGSVAAIVAGVTLVTTGWPYADPIASVAIAILLAFGAVRLLRESGHVLMEGAPDDTDVAAIERTIRETPGVVGVHDLHVWAVTPGTPLLTAHVVLARGEHGTELARVVGARVKALHGIDHVTIQPEAADGVVVPLRLGR